MLSQATVLKTKTFSIDKSVSDLLKITAALLVMFAHYCNIKAQAGGTLNVFELCMRSQGGNIGVAIFFFLSGYGLMASEIKSHLSAARFFKKRFCKIYLPVLLATALWLPISYKIASPSEKSYLLVISDLLWGFKDPVLWFIRVLILLYASFFLSTLWLSSQNGLGLMILWIGTIATCCFSYFTNGSFGLNSISGIPLFAVGVVTALWGKDGFKNVHPAMIALVASFAAISTMMSFFPRFVPNVAHVMADYTVVATIIMIFSRWRPTFKFPPLLALLTFDICLVHFKVLTVMKVVSPSMPIAFFIAATLFLSLALYFLRTKLIRL